MELIDFTPQGGLVLEDFQSKAVAGAKLGTKTAAQLAATEVALSGSTSVDEFRKIKEELLSPEGRQRFILRQEAMRNSILSDAETELPNLLLDENVPIEERGQDVQGFEAGRESYKPNTIDTLAEQAVISPSGSNENEEQADSRDLMLETISSSNAYKRDVQSQINAVKLGEGLGTGGKLLDVAELIVPWAEWINTAQLMDTLSPDQENGRFLLGTKKEQLYGLVKAIPVNERPEFVRTVIRIISDQSQMVLPDGNDLAALENLERMLLYNDYSDIEKFVDNATGILDVVGLGAIVKSAVKYPFKAVKGAKASVNATEVLADESLDLGRSVSTRTEVAPTSPSQVVKDYNPESAREMHRMALDDETGEAAEALYGASREEAIAKDLLPEPDINPGRVENKVSMPDQFHPGKAADDAAHRDGNTYLSDEELEFARNKTLFGLNHVDGMKVQPEKTVVGITESGGMKVSIMYHPVDAGFRTSSSAIENAVFSLRNYGVVAEDLTLYARTGSEWVETTQAELATRKIVRDELSKSKKKIPTELKEIDYAVGLKYEYKFSPEDLEPIDLLTVKRNWLDMLPPGFSKMGQGSLTQNLFDPASVLPPRLASSAASSVDKTYHLRKTLVDMFEGFTDTYKKMPQKRRAAVADYINEANSAGIPFSRNDLYARGFSAKEIDSLSVWRKANDVMFQITNRDMVKTLISRGYKVFTHAASNTRLIVKPLARQSVKANDTFYEASSNTIKTLTKNELDDLYSKGGSIVATSEPFQVGKKWVDNVIDYNNPSNGYTRALNRNEAVLNYREGYYPVKYNSEFFITVAEKGVGGKKFNKTFASAGTLVEADEFLKGLRSRFPAKEFDIHPNKARTAGDLDEQEWAVGVSSGLSNQRVRGERLIDASASVASAGKTNLVDPLEAVAAQVQRVSERVGMRNFIETTKSRWIKNYGEALKLPKDKFGKHVFPAKISDITKHPEVRHKLVADARTLFNYINSLENGYINGIDTSYKAVMHSFADMMGEWGVKSVELLGRSASTANPMSAMKGLSFKLFLAANPFRQLIIQAHQSVQLMALNPKYVMKNIAHDLYRIGVVMRGGTKDTEAVKMWDEMRRSGFMEAVDSNNLIRQDQLHLADLTVKKKIGSLFKAPLKIAQRVGFDAAEQSVLVTSWLAHYDLAKKAGKASTLRDFEEIAGAARLYTYGMNRAGDMPYNSNTLSVIAQFVQVPHKAMLQPFVNRNLTRVQRARLLAFNTVMYGVPTGVAGYLTQTLPDTPVRKVLIDGLEDVLLNQTLSTLSGTEQQIDWGDFSPSNVHGTGDFVVSLITLDLGRMVAESPVANILFGGNSRMSQAFKTGAKYFHLVDDYDDPTLNTNFGDVVKSSASLFSGYSNAFKANYAYHTGTKINSMGNISDSDVTKIEAVMQLFGFQTKTEVGDREVKEILYKGNTSFTTNDVDLWYNDLKRHLARRGKTINDDDLSDRAIQEAWRVFGEDELKARNRILSNIQRDAKAGDYDIILDIQKAMGLSSNEDINKMVESLPDGKAKDALRVQVQELFENAEGASE